MRFTILCALAAALAPFAAGAATESEEKALAVLRKSADAYRSLHSYRIEVKDSWKIGQPATVAEGRGLIAGMDGKFRFEIMQPRKAVRISDGSVARTWSVTSKEYAEEPAANAESPIARFQQLDRDIQEADVAREETLDMDGGKTGCYVIRVVRKNAPPDSFAMYRIEKERYAVRKLVEYGSSSGSRRVTHIALYSISKWNEPVGESLFVFPSLEGYRKVGEVSLAVDPAAAAERSTGKAAPDFILKDLNGRNVSLAELRGKVVLVDFWATWCPPCREEMPHLEHLYQELKDSGLAVLGLDAGEAGEAVKAFAHENHYTFPMLLGAEPEVSGAYDVDGYPTIIVIGRTGNIVARFEGSNPNLEDDLRDAIARAGIGGPANH